MKSIPSVVLAGVLWCVAGWADAQTGELNVKPEIKFDDSRFVGANQVEDIAYRLVVAYTQEVINAYEQEYNKQMGITPAAPSFEYFRVENDRMLGRIKQAKYGIGAVKEIKSGKFLKEMHASLTHYIKSLTTVTTLLHQKEYQGWQGEAEKQMVALEEKLKSLEEQAKLAIEKSGQVSDLQARIQAKEAEIQSTLAEARRLDMIMWAALGISGMSLLVSLVRLVKN